MRAWDVTGLSAAAPDGGRGAIPSLDLPVAAERPPSGCRVASLHCLIAMREGFGSRRSTASLRGACVLIAFAIAASPSSGPIFAGEDVRSLRSPRQRGETSVRIFHPDSGKSGPALKTLYVLPVEAGTETRWGDPSEEVRRLDLANRHKILVVLPTFSDVPWYADHPTDASLRQESYFLQDVLPLVERLYPGAAGSAGRLLVGFSKSGWGAWALLLRHPEVFDKAAAWDAPLMQAAPDRYGMGPIFGGQPNFEEYRITALVRKQAPLLRSRSRLVLTGYAGSFRRHHVEMHSLLDGLGIPHEYRDGPQREHHWQTGWLEEAVALLLAP